MEETSFDDVEDDNEESNDDVVLILRTLFFSFSMTKGVNDDNVPSPPVTPNNFTDWAGAG